MNPLHYARCLLLVILVVSLTACSSLLPRARSATSAFHEFEELSHAVDSLQPMQSKKADLVRLGIDPSSLPNTTILSYADIVQRFVPLVADGRPDLDNGILACLRARDACRGWQLNASAISKVRTGSFFADFVNFRRRTETTGWRFNALILLADDVVVYRAWGGQPLVNDLDIQTNPLGPLQDIGLAGVVKR